MSAHKTLLCLLSFGPAVLQDEFLSTVWDRSDPAGVGGLPPVDEQPERSGPTPLPALESAPVSHPDYRRAALCVTLTAARPCGAFDQGSVRCGADSRGGETRCRPSNSSYCWRQRHTTKQRYLVPILISNWPQAGYMECMTA